MGKLKENKSRLLSYTAFLLIIAVMVLAAEVLEEQEIIFPEVAAIAIGVFLAQTLSWKVSYIRMAVCIELCALLGVGIVLYVPLPLWGQILLAYLASQLVFMLSGTSFAPMISAAVLPVLLKTNSIVYPVSALCLTLLIILIRRIFERRSIKSINTYNPVPLPQKKDWIVFLFRTVFVAALAPLCVAAHAKFCIAPPLLVAFTELCRPNCPAANKMTRVVLLVSLCAAFGAAVRYVLVMHFALPLWLAALAIGLILILLVEAFKLHFPPAGAMAVLALLIPQEALPLYPLQVLIGITVLSLAARIWAGATAARTEHIS